MIQSLNFPLSKYCVEAVGGWDVLAKKLRALGMDGVEAIVDPDDYAPAPKELVSGFHMVFYPDWVDYWRQDEKALLQKFGSWDKVKQIYRGTTPEELLEQFRADLAIGRSYGTPYVVFHVTDVSLEEGYTYRWLHSDKEVMDAAIEFINLLLKGVEPTFDFLVENQWWPGFTFTEPEKTEYLLSRIDYPRKGVMLDTGHLMSTNTALRSQKEGVAYILRMLANHGELSKAVRGLHFHQSLSGSYVRKTVGEVPADFPEEYFAAFAYSYSHIGRIDRHRPWTEPSCVSILDAVQPSYLTHELSSGPRRSQLGALKRQLGAIRRGWEQFREEENDK